jgi:16S rRNA (cytidine1402-2'-O)-methyltransferase
MVSAISKCELLLCESISAAQRLCQYAEIKTPRLVRYFSKNEKEVIRLLQKSSEVEIGLISDAGTPLISDPGYEVVRLFHKSGWKVNTVPGPSAVISALVLSGMPTDSFTFHGFLPPKSVARQKVLIKIAQQGLTWVAYESPRRILGLCEDVNHVFGALHEVCVIKEMTKVHETMFRGDVGSVIKMLQEANLKGEFVIVGKGSNEVGQWEKTAVMLRKEISIAKASSLTAEIYNISKSSVYRYLLGSEKS